MQPAGDALTDEAPSAAVGGLDASARTLSPPLPTTHSSDTSQATHGALPGATAGPSASQPAILKPPVPQRPSGTAPASLPPPPAPLAPLPPPELQEQLQRLQQSHEDMHTALAGLSSEQQPNSTAAPPPSGASKLSGSGDGDSAELAAQPESGGAQEAQAGRAEPDAAAPDATDGQWHDVTADGGVRRRLITAGAGETPPLHAVCMGAAGTPACLTARSLDEA